MKLEDIRVGDRLRFRQWDDMAEEFGLKGSGCIDCLFGFIDGMAHLCGRTVTVARFASYDKRRIIFEEDFAIGWSISADMLEPDQPEMELSDPFTDSDFSMFIMGGAS